MKDLAIFDLNIEFLVNNCEYKPNFVKNAPRGAEQMEIPEENAIGRYVDHVCNPSCGYQQPIAY